MSAPTVLRWIFAFCACLGSNTSFAQNGAGPDPFTYIYDTVKPMSATDDMHGVPSGGGWEQVPPDTLDHSFQGDAVVANDRIAVLVRTSGTDAELFSFGNAGLSRRARLHVAGAESAAGANSVTIVNNAQDHVAIEVKYDTAGGEAVGMRLELFIGQPFVKTSALGAAERLAVEAPCDLVAMPDFFADDIVIGTDDILGQTAELPSENFLLHFCDSGNAVVVNVWENRKQEVRVAVERKDGRAEIERSEIAFGEGGAVWVAVLAEPGIWHTRNVTPDDRNKILPLEWNRPFPAVWRVDWRRDDLLTDSWEMAIENADGSYRKSDLFETSRDAWTDEDWWAQDKPRYRWNTGGLGGYMYPCWIDKEGKAFLQPLKKQILFDGPAVIYPINRSADTPLSEFTVTDIVRNTLGMGPCEYILDLEGQDLAFRGKPTCATRDFLVPIYKEREQALRQSEVSQALDDVLAFMQLIRGRIEEYIAFKAELQTFLEEAKAKHPEQSAFVDEMLEIAADVDEAVARHREGMNTPEHATELVETFRANLVGYEGPDALEQCKELTDGFVKIGDNQDELVAECRLAIKVLRQRAALELARNPDAEPIVAEIRTRTQEILRDPVNYEAARH